MKREQKDYIGHRFEVEPTKLTKLVQVMHEKLAGPVDQSDSYVVYMAGDHKAELQTLDGVLALDNSAKHRIVRLRIHSECRASNGTLPQSEIDVDFGATFKTGSGSSQGVSIEVAGESGAWVTDTLSEVEQQVERSWVQHTYPIVFIALILFASLFTILLSILGPSYETNQIARDLSITMWLTPKDISPYAEKLSRAETLSEDEQRQILSKQVANVDTLFKHYDKIERESLWPVGKSLLAVAVIAAVGIALLIRGHPAAVFLWGDEKSRQETRERTKRVLWALLLAISLIPVIVQLFLPSLLSGFR
jgi:hypothetical protein